MEETIYRRLDVGNLRGRVFYSKAASDAYLEENYPQIIIETERFSDAVHGVAGLLHVEIICAETGIKPEEIEPEIRRLLEGVFFRSERPFILKWNKSEVFSEPASERLPLIIGTDLTFEIYEFASGITSEPDAITGLWDYYADAVIIGRDDFGEVFIPTNESPALYFSIAEIKLARAMYSSVFVRATVKVHVFAPDLIARQKWLTAIYQELALVKAIKLRDGSPMRLEDFNYNLSADEIAGQLTLEYEYGIPRRFEFGSPINKIKDGWRGKKCTR